jgi:hypothetical protein
MTMPAPPRVTRQQLPRDRSGLVDHSARPHRSPSAPPAAVVARMLELRRQRWTCARIARPRDRHRDGSAPSQAPRTEPAHGARPERAGGALPTPSVRRASSTSTSSSLAASSTSVTASLATVGTAPGAPAGSSLTSPIDDASRVAYIEVLPDDRQAPAPSSTGRSPGSEGLAWGSSAS